MDVVIESTMPDGAECRSTIRDASAAELRGHFIRPRSSTIRCKAVKSNSDSGLQVPSSFSLSSRIGLSGQSPKETNQSMSSM